MGEERKQGGIIKKKDKTGQKPEQEQITVRYKNWLQVTLLYTEEYSTHHINQELPTN